MRETPPPSSPDHPASEPSPRDGSTRRLDTAALDAAANVEVFENRYRVQRFLGRGSFGEVFLAEDSLLNGELVAVKRLRADPRDPGFFGRFQVEIRANQRLKHERIPQVRGFDRTASGELYYTMEYIDGRSLKSVLESEGRLEPERVRRIAVQILEVLVYAHSKGIVHRDLKPGNLMVTESGEGDRIHVLDFGIAKILNPHGGSSPQASLASGFGTPEYIAPEQFLGREVDGRADVYSLGVLVYQAACGWLPFYGENAQAMAAVRLHSAPREIPPGHVVEWLPPILERLLAIDPKDRPSAGEALELFRGAAGSGTASASPTGASRSSDGGLSGKRSWIVFGSAILALALGGLWWLVTSRGEKPDPLPSKGDATPLAAIEVSFTEPREGSLHGSAPVRFAGRASGTRGVVVSGRSVEVSPEGTWAVEFVDLPEGSQQIGLRAVDDDLARTRAVLTVVVDRTPPRIEWRDLPGSAEGNARLVSSSAVTVHAQAVDEGPAGLAELRIDSVLRECDASGASTAIIQLEPDVLGAASVYAQAMDRAGNLSEKLRLEFQVDVTPPEITVKNPNALERSQFPLESPVFFEGRVLDAHPPASLLVDGRTVPLVDGSFSTSVRLDAPRKEVELFAIDRAGNRSLLQKVELLARIEPPPGERTANPAPRDGPPPAPIAALMQWTPPLAGLVLPPSATTLDVSGTADAELDTVVVNGTPAVVDGRTFKCRIPLAGDGVVFQVRAVARAKGASVEGILESSVQRRPIRVPAGCVVDGPRAVDPSTDCALRVRHERTGIVLLFVPNTSLVPGRTLYIAETETTVRSWRKWKEAAADSTSLPVGPDDLPITGIAFDNALDFCRWAGLALPTRAEWLRAARKNETDLYAWGSDWKPECGNTKGVRGGVAAVGSFPCDRSYCGALDMTGNVNEWCVGNDGKPALIGGSWISSELTAVLGTRLLVPSKPTFAGFRSSVALE